ncbi:class I adenylate-forming enzyme family protein [Nocardia vaccinii]|uniref:class I adenylate-forming enzyme family protein n=1 Tax=Nocardia vaccinii TaxID=1822 RepID=UPI00082969F2|nr:long-chain fatty acid--CoA ligase [Nocardia vaccinii]
MNLSLLLDMASDGFGDRTLIGRKDSGLTAERLRQLTIGGARAILEAGADSVVYLGVNGPMFPIALFSAARAGVPLVPINFRLGAEQLEPLLANHPKAVGLAGPGEIGKLRAAGLTAHLMDDWMSQIGELADEAAPETNPPETNAPAVMIYTSGTTSKPKGVLIKHDNLTAYVFGSVEFGSAEASDAALISVPPYHIAAVANAITNLYAGRRTVVLEQFTAQQWLETVREQAITNALVVPTMLARIIDTPDEQLAVPSLRTLAYGGAPMPAHVIERALQQWPNVGFVNAYGLTETSSTVAVLGPEDHRTAIASTDPRVRSRLSSVGQVVPAIEMQIRDQDRRPVEAGVVGRIWVRGDQVSGEYAGSGKAIDEQGWFDTRDQGYLDEDGFLFVGGRADDTIIRGAENIAPAEIEDVLLGHCDVDDAVVVGIPDDEWGQHIEAAVVLRDGATATPEDLRAHVREHLRGSKTPDRVQVWAEVPRTETGKLLRRQAIALIVGSATA